ncbi:MAG: hypothetical protein LWY06_07655 [Firmicutes bacterium]|nr:hypothetical protein [Bacillota bacterium]
MQIGNRNDITPRAMELKNDVLKMAAEIVKLDNTDKVDLSSKDGEVVITRDAMLKAGAKSGIIIPAESNYKHEVVSANVVFDPATKEVKNAKIDTLKYYDSSYGRSAEDGITFDMHETDKGGKTKQVYTQSSTGVYIDEGKSQTAIFDKESGNAEKLKTWKEGKDFLLQLGRTVTSGAGLFLTGVGGLLAAAPGITWGLGAAFSTVAGPVGAAATCLALAYAKTRMND